MRVLLDAAKAYEGKKNEPAALQYANESFAIAQQASVKQYMQEGYLVLADIYNNLQKNDSAYLFHAAIHFFKRFHPDQPVHV